MLCDTASNNILENDNREEDMLCVTTAEIHEELQDEDMLCLSSSAVYFFQRVYQKLCLRCQVPSREGMYEWDMLAIKIFKKK